MNTWQRAVCVAAAVFLCGALAGCAPANREKLTEEILAVDPEFASVLAKHRELTNRMDTYQQELALKRKSVDEAIAGMRNDLKRAVASVRSKSAEAKRQMQPEVNQLELKLALAGEKLRAAQVQRASLGRSVSELRKSLKRDGTLLAAEDRTSQQSQMAEMERDASRLDHEMAALKEHVRLLKVKLLLIKL